LVKFVKNQHVTYYTNIPVVAPKASCVDVPPMYVWPLNTGSGLKDVITNVTEGAIGPDAAPVLDGDAYIGSSSMKFQGTAGSYVDLNLRNSTALWESEKPLREDYSISMLIYMNGTSSGTLFHFQSASFPITSPVGVVERIRFYVLNSFLHAEYEPAPAGEPSGLIVATKFQVLPNTWTQVAFGRDSSNSISNLVVEGETEQPGLNNLNWMVTQFPGTLRVGGSFDGATEPFNGKIHCVQVYASKYPCHVGYLESCNTTGAVPTTTSTTTSTSTSTSTSTTASTTVTTTGATTSSTAATTTVPTTTANLTSTTTMTPQSTAASSQG